MKLIRPGNSIVYKPEAIENMRRKISLCEEEFQYLKQIVQPNRSVTADEIRRCATSEENIRETMEYLYAQLIKPENIARQD